MKKGQFQTSLEKLGEAKCQNLKLIEERKNGSV